MQPSMPNIAALLIHPNVNICRSASAALSRLAGDGKLLPFYLPDSSQSSIAFHFQLLEESILPVLSSHLWPQSQLVPLSTIQTIRDSQPHLAPTSTNLGVDDLLIVSSTINHRLGTLRTIKTMKILSDIGMSYPLSMD